ncbi:hypothetical protein CR513_19404, partial [Mucuna pruriens]
MTQSAKKDQVEEGESLGSETVRKNPEIQELRSGRQRITNSRLRDFMLQADIRREVIAQKPYFTTQSSGSDQTI